MICSTRVPISFDFASDVPGNVLAWTVRLPSWNSGRNAVPTRMSPATAAATSSADVAITIHGWSSACGSVAESPRLSVRASQPSCPDSIDLARGRNAYDSAGVTTIATPSDASSATM